MKHFAILLKTQLKLSLIGMVGEFTGGSKKKISRIAIAVLIILAFAELFGMYLWLIFSFSDLLISAGQPDVFLTIVFLFCMLITLFFGLFQVIGNLYFAKDAQFLSSLPIKQYTVFAVKLTLTLIYELITLLPFALGALIIFGIKTSANLWFYLKSIPIIFTLPIIPMLISTLFAMFFMRFTALSKYRDFLTIVGSILLFVAIMYANQKINYMFLSSKTEEIMSGLLKGSINLSDIIGSVFPPVILATKAILNTGMSWMPSMIIYLLSTAVFVFIIILLSTKVYYKGLTAQNETAQPLGKAKRPIRGKQQGIITSVFIKEWRMLLRIPVYAINGLTSVFILPIMIFIMAGNNSIQEANIGQILNMLKDGKDMLSVLIITAMFSFIVGINPAASTVYSREGENYYFLKSLPISQRQLLTGKLLFSISIDILAIILTAATLYYFLPLAVWNYIGAIILSLLISIATSALNIAVDFKNPKLEWTSHQQAIKQNFNSLIGMLLSLALLIVLGFISAFLYQKIENQIILLITILTLFTIITAALVALLYKLTNKNT